MKYLLLIVLATSSLSSFSQKKILKQALAFEESQLYEQAAEKYMEALYQNATKPESKTGLVRTSQKAMNQKLSNFFIARNSADYEASIAQFDEVIKFRDKLMYFNVSLNIPQYHFADYESDKIQLIESLKQQAIRAYQEGNKTKSEALIKKIKKYEPNFDQQEVEQLASQINTGPRYDEAVQDFERGSWLDAWRGFSEVQAAAGNFKETETYKKKIREKATSISIVLPKKSRFSKAEDFKDNIIAEVSQLDNPLIKMVDRENLDQIIEEQKLGLSGILDERSAAALGKVLGVKAMVLIKVINYQYLPGALSTLEKTAYTPNRNQLGEISYSPAPYREYTQVSKVLVSLQHQLISTETAEILSADIINKTYTDELTYAKYPGDYNTLYPASEGYIHKSGKDKEAFTKLFTLERTPLSKEEIEFKIQGILANEVAASLNNYFSK